jgi:YVTN family beta-propeller protein
MKGTHGIALDPGRQATATSRTAAATPSLSLTATALLPSPPSPRSNPDGIIYEPVTATVWAFNGRSKSVSVIDTATNTVVATVALPGKPEAPTVDGKGNVYDPIENENEIVKLDAQSKSIAATWKLTSESPSGRPSMPVHGLLFAVCDGKQMAVVDTATGKQIASPAIGTGPDAAGFSPQYQLAFSSNGEGTLSVVDTAHGFKTIETLPTMKARAPWPMTPQQTACTCRPRSLAPRRHLPLPHRGRGLLSFRTALPCWS